MATQIHPLAVVDPGATIGEDCEIGPFCVVGAGVKLGPRNKLLNNVTIVGDTTIGEGNVFYPAASIGAVPQDLSFHGEPARLAIGSFNTFRECCQVNRGTAKGGLVTSVGDRNLIMACTHIAHDCVLEDSVILANNTLLGGHVKVESFATLAGAVVVHHFATIGRLAFVGGMTRVAKDVPPYMTMEGNPPKIWCVNKVGCERRGMSAEAMDELKEAHRLLFRTEMPWDEAFSILEGRGDISAECRYLMEFLRRTEAGKLGRAREAMRTAPVRRGPVETAAASAEADVADDVAGGD
jgi:UDP-N-acetylglucosamine acyltransferase